MLKSLTIERSISPLLQKQGSCGAIKLTIRNNGNVIYTEKDFNDNENTCIVTHKTFDKRIVKQFLIKQKNCLPPTSFHPK